MYVDKRRKRWPWCIAAVLTVLLIAGIWSHTSSVSGKDIQEGSTTALKEAVQRSALQCYVVEGIYPPNLSYLEDHYGLQINHEKFYVSYDAFASNLPPNIRVIPREE